MIYFLFNQGLVYKIYIGHNTYALRPLLFQIGMIIYLQHKIHTNLML